MTEQTNSKSSFSIFIIIWIGQLISLLGSGLTNFGLPIWVFEQSRRATDLTTIGGLYVGALLLMSPLAGVLVDRANRKLMMMLSDLGSGIVTLVVFFLFAQGNLEIWHLYIAAIFQGAFQSFQWPAFSAAISTMLSKEHYTRASTMLDLANTGAQVFAPLLAGAMFGLFGDNIDRTLTLILMIDVVTFLFAVGTLLFISVPQPKRTAAQAEAEEGGFLSEITYGWRYIKQRPSLLGLQMVFMLGNFFVSIAFALIAPMILSRTDSNELLFGVLQTIGAVGGIAGGIIISAWGGFKRRVHGVLAGWAVSGLLGTTLIGLGRPDPAWLGLPIWGAGLFIGGFLVPLINGSNQGIWQAKVSPDVQGKVFTIRRLIAWLVTPLSQFVAGPLADRLLEPQMAVGGALNPVFSWLVGTGPGAGMSLAYIFTGLVAMCVGLGGYLIPAIRNAEDLLPDHDEIGEVLPAEEAAAGEALDIAESGAAAR